MALKTFVPLSIAISLFAAPSAFALTLKVQGQEFMPYQGVENGKLGGALQKITELICKKAAVDCVFELVPLNRSMKSLEAGESHIVLGIAKTEERSVFANFPDPMAQSHYTLFVKKGKAASKKDIGAFKGQTVAVYGPSATMLSAEKYEAAHPGAYTLSKETVNPEIPFKKLEGGRYGDDGGVYSARSVGMYYIKSAKAAIEPVPFDLVKAAHGMGVSKKGVDEATFKKLSDAQAEVMKSPEAKKILADYDLEAFDGTK